MTIYDIPGLVRTALPAAAAPKNVQAGFQCRGIGPYNPDIFEESEFAPSEVTGHPDPAAYLAHPPAAHLTPPPAAYLATPPAANKAIALFSSTEDTTSHLNFSPDDVQLLPNAGPRKIPIKGRKRKQSAILPDTPVKMQTCNLQSVGP